MVFQFDRGRDSDGIYVRRRFVCLSISNKSFKTKNLPAGFHFYICSCALRTGDRMLRYINGEWANVNAKCKRQKSLGYYDDNDDDDTYSTDQLDKYSYDKEVNEDIDDDYLAHNQRPDLFWMGDGFHKQVYRRYCSTPAPFRQRHMHRVDYIGYNDEQNFGQNGGMLDSRYSNFSAVALVGQVIKDDGRSRSVRSLPQSPRLPSIKPSMHRGYHPYSRSRAATPAATPAPTTICLRSQMRGNPAIQSGTAKCHYCNRQPAAPQMNRKIQVQPVQIQLRKPIQLQEPKRNEPGPSSSATTTAKIHQTSNGNVQEIENNDRTVAPESTKIKAEYC